MTHTSSEMSEENKEMSVKCVSTFDLPSATAEAMETYENVSVNIYCGTATGRSIASESMPCECKYDPNVDDPSAACGDDDHCINRMMFMECVADDCPCGRYCRNRRFQLKQYARVDVIVTEKKGYGLRALTDLPSNAFIMEYIGEVISNNEFVKRTQKYEKNGVKHYYFMTLKTDEIIDATKRGCLARFINHSCNPNSVTQKWVVGKTMRVGLFTIRPIAAGEELTFDYKFERYGAAAQKCYCNEPNCKGYIGGELRPDEDQEEDVYSPQEQPLDEDEDSDSEETAIVVPERPPKKNRRERRSRPLQHPDQVQSFVKTMLDSVGKADLVNKLLLRLELTNPETPSGREVLKKFIRLHGLKMLKFWLGEWKYDNHILEKVLRVLQRLPLANRNGLEDAKLFDVVQRFTEHSNDDIKTLAVDLLETWSHLKSVYRIPKRVYVPPESTETTAAEPADGEAPEYTGQVALVESKKPPYKTTNEFFDPGEDYYEYIPLNVTPVDLDWLLRFPPHPAIPAAPRAMLDSATANSWYAYTYNYAMSGQNPTGTSMSADPYTASMVTQHAGYTPATGYVGETLQTTGASEPGTETAPANFMPKLPPNWKSARSEEGYVYYYNTVTRKTQWTFPEEKASSIEGVSRTDLDGLVEQAMQQSELRKQRASESASPANSVTSKAARSPHLMTPTASTGSSMDTNGPGLSEIDLKREVGKVVTKYLTVKHAPLWHGDKQLFKDLARKLTHHVVDREIQARRKINGMNSALRSKIEKFIDLHGAEFAGKLDKS